MFWNADIDVQRKNGSTVQLFHQFLSEEFQLNLHWATEVGVWAGWWRTSFFPVININKRRRPSISKKKKIAFLFVPNLCAFQHINKTWKKLFPKKQLWENSGPRLPSPWTMIPKAPRPKTSHGLWLLFLLCLLLICVIRVSIKHYEIQSVQIDISKKKSYFHPYG